MSVRPTTPQVNTLIRNNVRLPEWFCGRWYREKKFSDIYDDLLAEARVGLVLAAQRYDSARGSFSGYAVWWMRATCTRYLEAESRRGFTHLCRQPAPYLQSSDQPIPGTDHSIGDSLPEPNVDLDSQIDLTREVLRLPVRQRAVALGLAEGRTLYDIGRAEGISRQATASRIKTARRQRSIAGT